LSTGDLASHCIELPVGVMFPYCITYRYAHNLGRTSRISSLLIGSKDFVQVSFTHRRQNLPVAYEKAMQCDVIVSCYNVTVSSRINKHDAIVARANTETLHHTIPPNQDLLCIAIQPRWPQCATDFRHRTSTVVSMKCPWQCELGVANLPFRKSLQRE
jgi:hypothetical protein